jgi:pimeloyl-ACP methyl ester carboxylesterase
MLPKISFSRMKNTIFAALLATFIAFALTISPEEPEYIPYKVVDNGEDTVRFLGGDGETLLTGYWHLPTNSNATNRDESPVILLAHGLGLVQGKSLHPFVEAFHSVGYAVVTFDYATFGKSDGFPRHQIHPESHIADIHAALAMIDKEGKNRGADVTKIALWGFSLGGGHVLMAAAAAGPSVRAVVAQVPHIASGFETVLGTLISEPVFAAKAIAMFLLGLTKLAIWKAMNQQAYYPIVGPPGSAAFMQNPGDDEGYLGVLNPGAEIGSGWKNAATTESGLHLMFYRPLSTVENIELPVLLVAAEHDSLCPPKYIQAAKERIPKSEILTLRGVGHFDIYHGDALSEMLSRQIKFFQTHLN